MTSLLIRITVALLACGGIALGLYQLEQYIEQKGYDRRDREYQAAELAAEREARATEQRQAEQLTGAINVRTQTTSINQAAAATTHLERERVRDAFAARAANLPTSSADACTNDRAAYAKLLEAVGQAVDQLTEDAERIALDADGHAADSLMYQRIGGIAPTLKDEATGWSASTLHPAANPQNGPVSQPRPRHPRGRVKFNNKESAHNGFPHHPVDWR
jgi:hypothetical protein